MVQIAAGDKRRALTIEMRIHHAPLVLRKLALIPVVIPDNVNQGALAHREIGTAIHAGVCRFRLGVHTQRRAEGFAIVGGMHVVSIFVRDVGQVDNACLINFRVGRDPTVGGVDDLNLPAGMGDSDAPQQAQEEAPRS